MDATFVDALRCGLTGQVMVDPVVVWTECNPRLVQGVSYERAALQRWLAAQGDRETRFSPNPALKGVIEWFDGVKGSMKSRALCDGST